jgi:solute carrier family 25 2-oxodicarboxylate transporter 21
MINLMRDVYRQQGFKGLMCGWQGVQGRQMLWTGTYFATLDSFKGAVSGWFPKGTEKKNSSYINFLAGFFAGVAGAAANTPVDVVRTNIQKQALERLGESTVATGRNAFDPTRLLTVGKEIVSARGAGALYKGFFFKALHMGGSGACVAWLIPVFSKMFGINKAMM